MKAILYSDIKEKKSIVEEPVILSPLESLIHCLNIMDFNAALAKQNPVKHQRTEDIE